jgi:hypothetical protein
VIQELEAKLKPAGLPATGQKAGEPSGKPYPPATLLGPSAVAGPAAAGPPGGPKKPPESPEESKARAAELVRQAEEFAVNFVGALEAGDDDAAKRCLLSDDLFREAVNPGFQAAVGTSIQSENADTVAGLLESLKGKSLRHKFQVGKLSLASQRSFFVDAFPTLTGSVIDIDAGGVEIPVRLEQMVYFKGAWRALRLVVP